MSQPLTTPCWIYQSARRDEMYLYLSQEARFEIVPGALLKQFGIPSLVMQLELSPSRKLAREDVTKVMENLRTQGFHLQLPPKINPQLYHGE